MGFALTQIALAIGLGSLVAAGVAGYYKHTADTQQQTIIVDTVLKSVIASSQKDSVGLDPSLNLTVNGIDVKTEAGRANLI